MQWSKCLAVVVSVILSSFSFGYQLWLYQINLIWLPYIDCKGGAIGLAELHCSMSYFLSQCFSLISLFLNVIDKLSLPNYNMLLYFLVPILKFLFFLQFLYSLWCSMCLILNSIHKACTCVYEWQGSSLHLNHVTYQNLFNKCN